MTCPKCTGVKTHYLTCPELHLAPGWYDRISWASDPYEKAWEAVQ